MKVFRYSRVLIAIIAIGLIAALAIDFARNGVEQQNTRVDLAIDYEGLQELAQREGLPEAEVLQAAKDAGITSLAVYETTFKKLNENGKTTAVSGARLLESYHDGTLTDPAWRKLVEDGEDGLGREVRALVNRAENLAVVAVQPFRHRPDDAVPRVRLARPCPAMAG